VFCRQHRSNELEGFFLNSFPRSTAEASPNGASLRSAGLFSLERSSYHNSSTERSFSVAGSSPGLVLRSFSHRLGLFLLEYPFHLLEEKVVESMCRTERMLSLFFLFDHSRVLPVLFSRPSLPSRDLSREGPDTSSVAGCSEDPSSPLPFILQSMAFSLFQLSSSLPPLRLLDQTSFSAALRKRTAR